MHKDKIISLALSLIIGFKLVDIYVDFKSEVSYIHLAQELTLVIISLSLFIFLMKDIFTRSKQTNYLLRQLDSSQHQQKILNKQLERSKHSFFDAINTQFAIWELTVAEHDIALFLLKGLTIAEMASLMQKSEKTVRNQASSVYKKAQVSGRHELAAIFFEFWEVDSKH